LDDNSFLLREAGGSKWCRLDKDHDAVIWEQKVQKSFQIARKLLRRAYFSAVKAASVNAGAAGDCGGQRCSICDVPQHRPNG
jgi:hypothetical protein